MNTKKLKNIKKINLITIFLVVMSGINAFSIQHESGDVNLLNEAKKYLDLALDKEEESDMDERVSSGSSEEVVDPSQIEYFEPLSANNQLSDKKSKIIKQMFSSESKDLRWPSLPRVWIEKSMIDQKNFNSSLGLQFNQFKLGFKFKASSAEYYSLKTSVVIATSLTPKKNNLKASKNKIDLSKEVNELTESDINYHNILIKNEKNLQVYPNASEEFPMVGFCTFEVKYAKEHSEFAETSFFGSNLQKDHIKSEPVVYLFTSKIFQISKNISIRNYMHSYCGTIFKNEIEKKVLADFEKIKNERDLELNLKHNTEISRECVPQTELEGLYSDVSDDDCVLWHESNFKKSIVDRTVARCTRNKNDSKNYCKIYSKENVRCPIYYDIKSKKFTTELSDRSTVPATNGHYENPCDPMGDLQCVFEDKPSMLFNFPFSLGKGICVRK